MDIRRVEQIISKELEVNITDVKANAFLASDLNMDSLDLVVITMAFEEQFDIEIPDEIAIKWKTVDDIKFYIAKRLRK